MKKIVMILTILTLIIPTFSFAKTVRCKGKMINEGTSKYDLKKYCGKPDSVEQIGTKTGKSKYSDTEVTMEEWYYSRLSHGKDWVFIITGTRISRAEQVN